MANTSQPTAPATPDTAPSSSKYQVPTQGTLVINVPVAPADKGQGVADAVASIASSLAWPLLIGLALLVFKAPVTRLIDRIKTLKGAGMEVSAEAMIEKDLPARQPAPEEPDQLLSPLDKIVTAWVEVEKAARHAAQAHLSRISPGGRSMPYSTVLRNIEALERAEILRDPTVRPLVRDLAAIRNRAVHEPDQPINSDAVGQFVANAQWAAGVLRTL